MMMMMMMEDESHTIQYMPVWGNVTMYPQLLVWFQFVTLNFCSVLTYYFNIKIGYTVNSLLEIGPGHVMVGNMELSK